jgi:hypothetical protein
VQLFNQSLNAEMIVSSNTSLVNNPSQSQGETEYLITLATADVRGNGHDGGVTITLEGTQVSPSCIV